MRLALLWTIVALLAGMSAGAATSPASGEIEQLLARVQALEGAKFLRNGSAHNPREAAAHLRLKWEKQAPRIKTAEDFIAQCGTKSTVSGERYQIRFGDGRIQDSAATLTAWLAEIRGASRPAGR